MLATRSLAITLLLAVAGATQAAAQPASNGSASVAALDAYVAKAVRDWKVPGLAIAVVQGDRVVLAKGYGVRELGKPDAVDAGTRFAIGSTTKAMTAAALGMLVDEGKVKWDEKVTTYLPGFQLADPYVTRELTVRDLLTHRAGLGNADLLWAGADYPTAEILRRVGTLRPAYSLRSGFIYQNIMYAAAGEVVRAASGMPWDAFVRTRIFVPLGMTNTEATLAGLAGKPNVAAPHDRIRDTLRVVANRPVDPVAAAGSVWSSVDDMAKWMRFVLDSGRVGGKRLLSEATFRELLSPQTIAPTSMYPTMTVVRPHFFTYGLGWFLHDYAGEAVAMHTGSIDGMSAIIGLLPDRRVGVYVLANRDHAELRHALMYRVFDMYRGAAGARDWSAELLTLYGGLEAQADAARRQQEQRRVADTRPSLPLERYAGTYREPTFGDVVVAVQGGALQLTYGRAYAGRLEHWHYDTFRALWADPRSAPSLVTFAPDGTGGVASVRAFGNTFARVPAGR
ncbi:serine hydrolase [Roseisolibacter agri]|uniref:Serine hydrolase n=1 Tax=Roseisolibacter agri TaxID=2014610 RepID=A0AA37VEC7_9BACT|nr:serine hydrolase [Roseisolibacter agri]GLC24944.1 serine hydrolase [Roseisolibacter agri]